MWFIFLYVILSSNCRDMPGIFFHWCVHSVDNMFGFCSNLLWQAVISVYVYVSGDNNVCVCVCVSSHSSSVWWHQAFRTLAHCKHHGWVCECMSERERERKGEGKFSQRRARCVFWRRWRRSEGREVCGLSMSERDGWEWTFLLLSGSWCANVLKITH